MMRLKIVIDDVWSILKVIGFIEIFLYALFFLLLGIAFVGSKIEDMKKKRKSSMHILKPGAFKEKPDHIKKFECCWCGCVWVAGRDEYKEDWSKHSIPAYMNCPYCGTSMYSLDAKQDGKPHERKETDKDLEERLNDIKERYEEK